MPSEDHPDYCIAVLPLAVDERQQADPEIGELSRGFAAFLEARLRALPDSRVFMQHFVLAPKDGEGARGFVLQKSLWPLQQALELPTPDGVEKTHIVQGKVVWGDELVDLTLEVLDVQAGFSVLKRRIEYTPENFLEEFFDLLRDTGLAICPDIDDEALAALSRCSTRSAQAFRLYLLGLSQMMGTQLDLPGYSLVRALELFRGSMEQDRMFGEAVRVLELLAHAHGGTRDEPLGQAVEQALQAARRMRPDMAAFSGALGRILFDKGRHDAAEPLLADYCRATRNSREAQAAGAIVRYAAIHHLRKRPDEAHSLLKEAIRRFPKDLAILESLGVCHAEMDNYAAAESCWRQVLEEDPTRSSSLSNLGMVYWKRGDRERAEILFRHAVESPEPATQSFRRYVDFLVEVDRQGDADEVATEWVETHAEDWRGWMQLARVRRRLGQSRAAEYCLGRAEALVQGTGHVAEVALARFAVEFPDDFRVYERASEALGRGAAAAGAPDAGSTALAPAGPSTTGPGDGPADVRQLVVKTLRQLADRHPGYPFLWSALAERLTEMDLFESATAAQERLVELTPRDASARNTLGFLMARLGRRDDAIACFRRAIELAPGMVSYQTNLAAALIERGDREADDYGEAGRVLAGVVEHAPGDAMVSSLLDELQSRRDAAQGARRTPGFLQRLTAFLRSFPRPGN